jgi:hypothetical protein
MAEPRRSPTRAQSRRQPNGAVAQHLDGFPPTDTPQRSKRPARHSHGPAGRTRRIVGPAGSAWPRRSPRTLRRRSHVRRGGTGTGQALPASALLRPAPGNVRRSPTRKGGAKQTAPPGQPRDRTAAIPRGGHGKQQRHSKGPPRGGAGSPGALAGSLPGRAAAHGVQWRF